MGCGGAVDGNSNFGVDCLSSSACHGFVDGCHCGGFNVTCLSFGVNRFRLTVEERFLLPSLSTWLGLVGVFTAGGVPGRLLSGVGTCRFAGDSTPNNGVPKSDNDDCKDDCDWSNCNDCGGVTCSVGDFDFESDFFGDEINRDFGAGMSSKQILSAVQSPDTLSTTSSYSS